MTRGYRRAIVLLKDLGIRTGILARRFFRNQQTKSHCQFSIILTLTPYSPIDSAPITKFLYATRRLAHHISRQETFAVFNNVTNMIFKPHWRARMPHDNYTGLHRHYKRNAIRLITQGASSASVVMAFGPNVDTASIPYHDTIGVTQIVDKITTQTPMTRYYRHTRLAQILGIKLWLAASKAASSRPYSTFSANSSTLQAKTPSSKLRYELTAMRK